MKVKDRISKDFQEYKMLLDKSKPYRREFLKEAFITSLELQNFINQEVIKKIKEV